MQPEIIIEPYEQTTQNKINAKVIEARTAEFYRKHHVYEQARIELAKAHSDLDAALKEQQKTIFSIGE